MKKLKELWIRYTSRDFVEYYNRIHKNDEVRAVRVGEGMKMVNLKTGEIL